MKETQAAGVQVGEAVFSGALGIGAAGVCPVGRFVGLGFWVLELLEFGTFGKIDFIF